MVTRLNTSKWTIGIGLVETALIMGILGGLFATIRMTSNHTTTKPDSGTPSQTVLDVQANPLPSIDSFSTIWTRNLKQSLIAPSTPEPIVQQPQRPLPRLVGTFLKGTSTGWAQFVDSAGIAQIVALHDTIDGYTLDTIERGRVRLRLHDKTHWVQVHEPSNPIQTVP